MSKSKSKVKNRKDKDIDEEENVIIVLLYICLFVRLFVFCCFITISNAVGSSKIVLF